MAINLRPRLSRRRTQVAVYTRATRGRAEKSNDAGDDLDHGLFSVARLESAHLEAPFHENGVLD